MCISKSWSIVVLEWLKTLHTRDLSKSHCCVYKKICVHKSCVLLDFSRFSLRGTLSNELCCVCPQINFPWLESTLRRQCLSRLKSTDVCLPFPSLSFFFLKKKASNIYYHQSFVYIKKVYIHLFKSSLSLSPSFTTTTPFLICLAFCSVSRFDALSPDIHKTHSSDLLPPDVQPIYKNTGPAHICASMRILTPHASIRGNTIKLTHTYKYAQG